MAEVDDWKPVTPQRQQQDDWVPVTAGQPVAITSGEKEFAADRAKIEAAKGIVPEELKTGAYTAANTALFNVPSHVIAAGTKYLGGDQRPYSEVYKEQKEYEQALERQNPKSAMAGTGAGILGSLLVPVPGSTAMAGMKGAKLAAAGATQAGLMSGASSAIENAPQFLSGDSKATQEAALSAGVGAVMGGTLAPIVGRIARSFEKAPEVVVKTTDAAGNVVEDLTPRGYEIIQKTFPAMQPSDIEVLKPKLIEAFQKTKGESEPAVVEAVANYLGLTPSKSITTGFKPKQGAVEAAEEARQANREILERTAREMRQEGISPTAGAEALQGAERDVFKGIQRHYKERQNVPGEFGIGIKYEDPLNPSTFAPTTIAEFVMPEITAALKKEGKITRPELLTSYPKSADALKLIENTVERNILPYEGPATIKNMFKIHQQMNDLQALAKGDDFATLGVIKQGYINSLDRAVEEGLFRGGDGAKAITDLMATNKEWSRYMKDWYNKRGGEANSFKKIMEAMVDPETGYVANTLTPGMAQAAQNAIDVGLLNPKIGQRLYERIENALANHPDSMEAFRAQIRNNVISIPEQGLSKLPEQIDKYLSPALRPMTEKAFGAVAGDEASIKAAREQMAKLRFMSESIKRIDKSPKKDPAEKNSMMMKILSTAGPSLVGGTIGTVLHGPIGGVVGAMATQGAYEIPKAVVSQLQRRAEQFGAPVVRPEGSIDPRLYRPFTNISAWPQESRESGYEAPRPLEPLPRQGRKSGGRVKAMTGEQLIAALEKAKREVNNQTKTLLHSSDETVARALEIANRNIEG